MFLAVQHAVSQEIIRQKSGQSFNTKVYLQRLPQIAYRDDQLLVALERFISMIIMLCFAYTFVNTVRVVTSEKELQLKVLSIIVINDMLFCEMLVITLECYSQETMTIMGLPSWLHWLAWFIKQFSFLLISVILMVILLKVRRKAFITYMNNLTANCTYIVKFCVPCYFHKVYNYVLF